MLGALVIVFREVIEAGLVVGIVLAATRGVPGRGRWVAAGVLAGVLGACVVALFAGSIANAFEGSGQEYMNAAILLVAVAMLTWHNVWMAHHGRELAAELRAAGTEVREGRRSLAALAVVVGLAVLREGSEVVLFLYGVVLAGGSTAMAIGIGGLFGLLGGAGLSALSYIGLVVIPTRYLFTVTSWLIALLAAGMAAQAMNFLNAAGITTPLDGTLWDTSHILSASSLPGQVLHTLIGYTDRPTALQALVYLMVLAAMFGLMRLASPRHQPATASG